MPAYDQKAYLLAMIDEAFDGVELGDGVSLHETIVLDMYGTDAERKRARDGDEKTDWHRLVHDPELKRMSIATGLAFFDAAGLRFHLPAYLWLAVTEPDADSEIVPTLIHTLAHFDEYNRKRLSILTGHQRRCVRHCLRYLRHNTGRLFRFHHREIEKAIETYWKPQQHRRA